MRAGRRWWCMERTLHNSITSKKCGNCFPSHWAQPLRGRGVKLWRLPGNDSKKPRRFGRSLKGHPEFQVPNRAMGQPWAMASRKRMRKFRRMGGKVTMVKNDYLLSSHCFCRMVAQGEKTNAPRPCPSPSRPHGNSRPGLFRQMAPAQTGNSSVRFAQSTIFGNKNPLKGKPQTHFAHQLGYNVENAPVVRTRLASGAPLHGEAKPSALSSRFWRPGADGPRGFHGVAAMREFLIRDFPILPRFPIPLPSCFAWRRLLVGTLGGEGRRPSSRSQPSFTGTAFPPFRLCPPPRGTRHTVRAVCIRRLSRALILTRPEGWAQKDFTAF